MTEKKLLIEENKKINTNIPKYRKNIFVVIFLARILSTPKNINNITKNKW